MQLVLHNPKGLHMQHKLKVHSYLLSSWYFYNNIFPIARAVGPPFNVVAEVTICGYLKGESHVFIYSKKSNDRPSEKQTTSLQQMDHLPPIDFTIELICFKPPRSGHLSTPYSISCSSPSTDYHAYRKYTECYNGYLETNMWALKKL